MKFEHHLAVQKIAAKDHIAKLLVLTLLTSGACVPFAHAEQDRLGQLYNAITYEDVLKAKTALAAGIDWANDGRTDHQYSTLHFAAGHTSSNGVEILKLLLASKADVNAQQRDRKTPLHLAASNGHIEIVKILIANKGDVKAKDLYKNIPLMCAVVAKHKEVEEFLRQQGAKE